jgi:amino acid transporter
MASTIPWSTSTANNGTDNVLIEHYKEHGQWARHYSTVRMTLGTFFLTLSFGILQFRWDKPEIEVAIVAGVMCFLGIIVFLLFSLATFNEMNNQLRIVNAFRQSLGTAQAAKDVPLYHWWTPSGLPLAIVFAVFFAFVDYKWVTSEKPKLRKGTEVMVPLVLQSGETRTILQVPIQISVDQAKTPAAIENKNEKSVETK